MTMNLNLSMAGSQPSPLAWTPRPRSPRFFRASTHRSGLNFNRSLPGKAHAESSPTTIADSLKMALSVAASVGTSIMLARTVVTDYLHPKFQEYFFSEVRNYLSSEVKKFFARSSRQATIVIEESDDLRNNQMYEDVQAYLGTKISPSARRMKVSKPEEEKKSSVLMDPKEEVIDVFNGVKVKWLFGSKSVASRYRYSSSQHEFRFYELSFHRRHQHIVINSYLPYIVEAAKSLREEKKTLKLYTWGYYDWVGVNLDHPATFETLAMDSETKRTILEDLEQFVQRKDYYRNTGKAWKRGYLLYGPPGTGKSSLVAAMANYLNFDIYDLELSEVNYNFELRTLLMETGNKSILVVEDIDRSISFHKRDKKRKQVTLSGLLNFIDGLWSSCGNERIIVLTTNHREKLDPALLRPGRMDVHINMSYCTPCGFKLLADNYLGVKDHALVREIEDLIRIAEVTPAEVAEQLLKGGKKPDDVFIGLIVFLKMKIKKIEELKSTEKRNGEVKAKKEQKKKMKNSTAKIKDDGAEKA